MDIYQGSMLITAAPVVISGGLDMYGAFMLGTADLFLSGILTTHGGLAGQGDSITVTSLTNTGTITFVGMLHTLSLGGNYYQSGTLEMRIGATSNDYIEAGTANLGGTL